MYGVDSSQNVNRAPHFREIHGNVIGPTIMPTGQNFVFGRFQRLTSGDEALEGQGFPVRQYLHVTRKYSNALKQDLAGNAFGGPVLLSIINSMLFTAPWTGGKTTNASTSSSSTDEVDDAMKMLANLRG